MEGRDSVIAVRSMLMPVIASSATQYLRCCLPKRPACRAYPAECRGGKPQPAHGGAHESVRSSAYQCTTGLTSCVPAIDKLLCILVPVRPNLPLSRCYCAPRRCVPANRSKPLCARLVPPGRHPHPAATRRMAHEKNTDNSQIYAV